jgi:hydrogenase maturation protein HypF
MDPSLFLEAVKAQLGPIARLEDSKARVGSWAEHGFLEEGPTDFLILPSVKGENDSSLPMDTAMCDKCLSEMLDPSDRRYRHPFTNCTDCGARFTVVEGLPYDRERTSMRLFPPCKHCTEEYSDESERRFHAQTLSCPNDGPRYRFLDRDLIQAPGDPFDSAAEKVLDGGIVAVKGWGGMHLVCDPQRLTRFREWYRRPYKPFALMARDISVAEEVAQVRDVERRALLSPARPIVLLRKRDPPPSWASEVMAQASPGLDSIGLYLPYAGVHHLLFKAISDAGSQLPWVLMTSGNPPGDPMALELNDITNLRADGYLVHDRPIAARCDDTVLVPNPLPAGSYTAGKAPFGLRTFPVRRSRGLVPDPLPMPHDRRVLSVGAERNVSVTVSKDGTSFTSQYIGNPSKPLVLEFARETAARMMELFGINGLEAIGADLHPRYITSRWAAELSERYGVPLIKVQHHHAHAASLLVDSGLDAMGAVVVDGVGFGDDGTPWGAEALSVDLGSCRRVGHLEPFGLPGGDSSVLHPERIAFWLTKASGCDMDLGSPEAERVLTAMMGRVEMTTSLGRLLDALSALMLGITWRSYDGEPAMRLEALLARSRKAERELFEAEVHQGIVPVICRWKALLGEVQTAAGGTVRPGVRMDPVRAADLCMGFVEAVVEDLVLIAGEGAPILKDDGRGRPVGLSGGVAYDLPVVEAFHRACLMHGLVPVLHSRVPPGDGGISVGQAAIAGRRLA